LPPKYTDNLRSIVYVGTSMYPLLRDLDILYFLPYQGQTMVCGDVIVYAGKTGNKEITITHRIVFIDDKGFTTKGDNNFSIDDIIVKPADILGLVVYVKRGNKFIRVRNGKTGIYLVKAIQLLLRIKNITIGVISYPYNWISKTGVLRKFVPRDTKQRIINIQRPSGMESHFLMGKYLVAKRRPGNNNWIILPPYKLFIDENSLPDVAAANDLSINNNEVSI
jgi:signal peptidase I